MPLKPDPAYDKLRALAAQNKKEKKGGPGTPSDPQYKSATKPTGPGTPADPEYKKLREGTIAKLRMFLEVADTANYLDDKGEVDAQQKMIKDKKVVDMGKDQNADKTVNDKDPVADKDFKGDRAPSDKGVGKLDPKKNKY